MTKKYFILLTFLCLFVAGCVEKNRLDKYDTAMFDTKKLEVVEQVELQPAEDQSMDRDPNIILESELVPTELSIEKCRQLALQNNLELKVSLISPEIAKEDLKAAHAKFEPLLFSGFNFVTDAFKDAPENNSISSYAGVNVPLVTGGSVDFTLSHSRNDQQGEYLYVDPETNESEFRDFQTITNNAYYNLTLSQPLLRNGGVANNTHNIRLASYSSKVVKAQTKYKAMAVLAATDKAYWSLYAAQEVLNVRRLEYDLAKAQFEQAQRMVDAGQAKEIEIIRAESAMAERLNGIINADNNLRNKQRELKLIINSSGMELDSESVIKTQTEPVPVKYLINRGSMVDYALVNRTEMLEIELKLASQESSIDFANNSMLPLLDLQYRYRVGAVGNSEGRAFDILDDSRLRNHSIGLELRVPVGNQAAKSRLRKVMLEKQQILTNKVLQEKTIKQGVLDAVDKLNAGWNNIIATQKSAELALRALEAEQRQFKLGLQTSTEVLNAQTKYSNALLTRLQALVEYQIAQIDLCFSVGGLNQAARLSFD